MLDINFIRNNVDLVKEGARKKRVDIDIDYFLKVDRQKREIQDRLDRKRAEQNQITKKISTAKKNERETLISSVAEIKNEIQKFENDLHPVIQEWQKLLMNIPNPPCSEMPEGKSDADNVVVHKWSKPTEFSFKPLDHIALCKKLELFDIERAAKVSGSRFYYLKGDLVLLQFAIIHFTFDNLTDEKVIKNIIDKNKLNVDAKPFVPMLPPVIIRNEVQYSIHRVFGDQTFSLQGIDKNLVASAEHTMAPYYMDETLDESVLPIRYLGYSTAFRQEAGTYGKDMGGIFRNKHFDKIEMETFSTAETGIEEQKLMVAIQEYLVQQLNIPYQLVHVCTGDTGKPDYDQYDIECWMPGQNKYRETHTSDYMTDYQTRGIRSFYKTKDGKRKLLHTNDATAFAFCRILIAILENYQQADGTIKIPEVLRPYMKNKEFIGA
ncbi:serine--tRNA ligase [Patescibacteria group bacterium]|nr:serine--tRNA ligase [Patescibacteria group bacterium]MBU1870951.1 serine--tRNA ligase [Patescibacteria group bacterium]